MDTLVAVGEWRAFLASGYSEKTQRMYVRTAMRFFRDTMVPVRDVRETDLAGWLEQFPYRSSSRRTHYNGLLSFFSWCLRNGVLPNNPLAGIRVPAPFEKVPRALSEDQYEAVLRAAYAKHPSHGYAVELLYYSAGRINEVLELRWDDATDEGIVFRTTKNGKERTIPWSEGLRRAWLGLKQWYGERERVLPFTQQTIHTWLSDAGKVAGVEKVHPHLFRATAATRMLKRGARPHAVKDVLGHSKIQTTTSYWAVEDADKQEAVGLLDNLPLPLLPLSPKWPT